VSLLLLLLDRLTGALIVFAVIFGPWAFGTTQPWSIQTMNVVGLALWALLAFKWLIRRLPAYAAEQMLPVSLIPGSEAPADQHAIRSQPSGISGSFLTRLLGWLTFLILLYCLVSAWNARATYQPTQWNFHFYEAIPWLPHSYDSDSSWAAFWMYLGLAGLFWSIRDWILSGVTTEGEPALEATRRHHRETRPLPSRLRLLLWVLAINGALLGLEGILQRTVDSDKLLWLVQPRINAKAFGQFGPYAYRANAAQYLNLLWPVTLGFWWTFQRARRREDASAFLGGDRKHHVLLTCALLMGVCPIISSSRGGAIIMAANTVLAAVILGMAQFRSTLGAKLGVFVLLAAMLGAGVLLGWEQLGPRFETYQEGLLGREALFQTGYRMAADQPLFGTGPGTFSTLYHLFRRAPTDPWPGQLHNDWLETFITFGWVGSSLIALALIAVLLRWFGEGGIYGDKYFVMLIWIALAGCMIHARFDFPFQIHSILALFLVLSAILSCLTKRARE
jgi:O-antigen ligase